LGHIAPGRPFSQNKKVRTLAEQTINISGKVWQSLNAKDTRKKTGKPTNYKVSYKINRPGDKWSNGGDLVQ
jgi:hypothetical protein